MKFFFILLALIFSGLVSAQEIQDKKFDPNTLKKNYEFKQKKIDAYMASKNGPKKDPLKTEYIKISIHSKDGSEGEYTIHGNANFKIDGTVYNKNLEGDVDNKAQAVISPGEKYFVTGLIRQEGEKAILITTVMKNVPGQAPIQVGLKETPL